MALKRNSKRAMEIGKTLAEQTIQRRRAIGIRRRAVLSALPTPAAPQAMAGPATRKARAARKVASPQPKARPVSAGTLIAEGDSWFDYPLHDVLKDLEDIHGYEVESVAHKGDTVEDMAYSGGQLDDFSRHLEKVLRFGVKPKAILLSGGGNDIAGDEFAILLNHAASSLVGLNESIVAGVIDQRLNDAYITILNAVTTLCRSQLGEAIPILLHGYDYPVPDGRGFLGGWWILPGPWLEPGFRRKGYTSMPDRMTLLRQLIDRFNAMLLGVCRLPQFAHVQHLDLRSTLPTGPGYKQWWGNELHPTRKGFERVTTRFADAIALLP